MLPFLVDDEHYSLMLLICSRWPSLTRHLWVKLNECLLRLHGLEQLIGAALYWGSSFLCEWSRFGGRRLAFFITRHLNFAHAGLHANSDPSGEISPPWSPNFGKHKNQNASRSQIPTFHLSFGATIPRVRLEGHYVKLFQYDHGRIGKDRVIVCDTCPSPSNA